MQIFNTLTRQKEEFVPQVPGEYRIYVCGPTVYNYIHIGNARPLIVFDTLRRYLEYRGNKVFYVSNITDIDDKLIKKGQEEGTSMKEVAQRFEAEYLKDAAGLNCKKPTVQPRATEHIQQILDIVKDLIDSGHAYVAKNGDVYFRVKSDPEYGKLSHLKLDDLESGNRELESWNMLYTQKAEDANVVTNLWDGLLSFDCYGKAVPSVAKEWSHNEDSSVWTFNLRDDVDWVDVNGEVFGKPHSPDDARRMLRALSGATHYVHTGVCVSDGTRTESFVDTCKVTFFPLSEEEIERYAATEEPYDKAGAYAIQGRAAVWLDAIEGDYYTIMGLPVSRTVRLLEQF